jgi:hypothetical protein
MTFCEVSWRSHGCDLTPGHEGEHWCDCDEYPFGGDVLRGDDAPRLQWWRRIRSRLKWYGYTYCDDCERCISVPDLPWASRIRFWEFSHIVRCEMCCDRAVAAGMGRTDPWPKQ